MLLLSTNVKSQKILSPFQCMLSITTSFLKKDKNIHCNTRASFNCKLDWYIQNVWLINLRSSSVNSDCVICGIPALTLFMICNNENRGTPRLLLLQMFQLQLSITMSLVMALFKMHSPMKVHLEGGNVPY